MSEKEVKVLAQVVLDPREVAALEAEVDELFMETLRGLSPEELAAFPGDMEKMVKSLAEKRPDITPEQQADAISELKRCALQVQAESANSQ